jgi:hypothetical protein
MLRLRRLDNNPTLHMCASYILFVDVSISALLPISPLAFLRDKLTSFVLQDGGLEALQTQASMQTLVIREMEQGLYRLS